VLLPKHKNLRDPKHLAFIRKLPCVRTGQTGCEACHIRAMTDGGTSLKPSDYYTVSLTPEQHRLQHQRGEKAYWGSDDEIHRVIILAQRLYEHTGNRDACLKLIREYQNVRT